MQANALNPVRSLSMGERQQNACVAPIRR